MTWTDNKIKDEAQKDPNFMTAFAKETNKLDIAVAMTDLRVSLGLTQSEFAQKVGQPQSLITRIESGEALPSFQLINEMATAVGKKPHLTFK